MINASFQTEFLIYVPVVICLLYIYNIYMKGFLFKLNKLIFLLICVMASNRSLIYN